MKNKILYFLGLVILLSSCRQLGFDRSIKIVDVPTVYNWKGLVKNYHLDKTKKKVVTYLGGVAHLKDVLQYTDQGKIDKIIRENPDFQFIFYIDRIVPEDTTAFMEVMRQYRCAFPVILDFKEEFFHANKDRHPLEKPNRMTKIGYICDKEGCIYEMSVIGTRKSFFDESFIKAKRQM